MTWVIADYTAANSGELSVHKGQQVEVLDAPSADWCLVRMPASSASGSAAGSATGSATCPASDPAPPPEGLVPLSVLRQPPQGLKSTTCTSPSRRLGHGLGHGLGTLQQDDSGMYLPAFDASYVSLGKRRPALRLCLIV